MIREVGLELPGKIQKICSVHSLTHSLTGSFSKYLLSYCPGAGASSYKQSRCGPRPPGICDGKVTVSIYVVVIVLMSEEQFTFARQVRGG